MPCAVISNFEKKTAKTARELSTLPKNTAAKSVQYAQKNLTTIQEISIVNVGNKKRRVNTIKVTLKQIAARCDVSTNTAHYGGAKRKARHVRISEIQQPVSAERDAVLPLLR